MEDLEDGHIRFNGAEGEFAAEVFTEGFRRDANGACNLVLRDAARSEKASEFAVIGCGAKGGSAGALGQVKFHR